MDHQDSLLIKYAVVRKLFMYPIEFFRHICRKNMNFSHHGPIKIATTLTQLRGDQLEYSNKEASILKVLDDKCSLLHVALESSPGTRTEKCIKNIVPGKVTSEQDFPTERNGLQNLTKNNNSKKESNQNRSIRTLLQHHSTSTEITYKISQAKNYHNKSVALIQTDELPFNTNNYCINNKVNRLMAHNKVLLLNKYNGSKFKPSSKILEEHSVVTIYHLPNEVMLKIFSYLTTTDLCLAVRFVNQHWRSLSEDESLWKEVEFHKNLVTTNSVISTLAKLPRLNSLTLCRREDAIELLQCVSLYNNQLKKLVVRACYCKTCLGFIRETLLCRVLEYVPDLVSLTIENCKTLNGEFFRTLRNTLPNLKELCLTSKGGHVCSEPLEFHDENYRLENLRHNITPLHNDNCANLIGRFRHTLKFLELDAKELEDPSMLAIAECYNLEKLKLIKAQKISDFGLAQIGKLSSLKELCVSGTYCVGPEGWMALFKFPNLRNLCKLELQRRCFELTEKALIACSVTCLRLERVIVAQNFRLSARVVGRMFLYGKQIKALDYHTASRVIKLRTLLQHRNNYGFFVSPSYYLKKEPIVLIMIPKEQDIALKNNSCTCLFPIS